MKRLGLFLCLMLAAVSATAQETGKDAVVAPVKMNILYRGISNQVEIAVPGVTSDKLTATTTNGSIKKVNNSWEILPGNQSESIITVLVNNKKVSEKVFRVKPIPNPVAVFANKYNGAISKENAIKTGVLEARLTDFDWDLKFNIVSFKFLISKDAKDFEFSSEGNKLTDEMKSLLAGLKSGQYITFKDIKAIGPDGKSRDLNPVILKIN